MSKKQSPDTYLTTQELADMLRVTPQTVSAWVRKGKLSPMRLGRRYLYRLGDIQNALSKGA